MPTYPYLMQRFILLLGMALIILLKPCSAGLASTVDTQVVKTFDFEEEGTGNWKSEKSDTLLLSKDTQHPHSGAKCLQLSLLKTTPGDKYFYGPDIVLTPLNPGDSRRLLVRLYTRTENLAPGKATIKFLVKSVGGTVRFGTPATVVTPSTEWTPMDIILPLGQNDQAVLIDSCIGGDEGHGTLWLDDIVVTDEITHSPSPAPIQTVALKTFDFEDTVTGDWKAENSEALSVSKDTQNPHAGAKCLQVRLLKSVPGEKYFYGPGVGLSTLASDDSARIHVKLYTRTDNLTPGKATIKFLVRSSVGTTRFGGPATVVTPSMAWTPMEISFPVSRDDQSITIDSCLSEDEGHGTLWLDDIVVSEEITHGHQISAAPFHVYTADQGSMTVNWAVPDQMVSGTIRVTDEQQQVRQVINVPAATASTQVNLASRGFYTVEASAVYRDGTTLTSRTTAAVIGTPLPQEVREQSRFGLVSVHGDHTLAESVGARWDWNLVRPGSALLGADGLVTVQPAFNFQTGLEHIVAFAGMLPYWLQPATDNRLYPPTDWTLLEKLVTAYAQDPNFPQYFTVWNEPDSSWNGTDEDFVRFHSTVARTIKAIHPETKVFGPGACNINMPRLQQWISLGLLNDLDGLVIHTYVNDSLPEQDFIQRVIDLKAYLASIGKADFPVYYTEFGWTTNMGTWQKPVDELTQAQYVSRSLALLSTTKFTGLCYFSLLYHTENLGEAGFALMYDNGTPRPGLAAYATLTRWLSTVNGEGRWLRLTPTANLTLYRNNGQTVGMLWTTEGQSSLQLPFTPTMLQDMMGRDLPITPTVTLTPSPIYFAVPGEELANITVLPSVTVQTGGTVQLPWSNAMVPAPLVQSSGVLTVPSTIPLGQYVILGETATGWQALPIIVADPLVIESTQTKLNELSVTVHSYIAKPATINAVLTLPNHQQLTTPATKIPAHAATTLSIPLTALGANQRYQGTVTIATTDKKIHASQPVAFTTLTCARAMAGGPDWSQIAALDFSNDAPVTCAVGTQKSAPFSPSDCSATVKTAYDDTGLYVQIRVRDNQHIQTQSPKLMWKEDSIQIGLDYDADREWRANDLAVGFNGHRIFEYGVALGKQGPMVWRWIAYAPAVKANVAEPRVRTQITREGDVTLYTICFPWATLGASAKPKSGSAIGLALLVNDIDQEATRSMPSMTRHGLQLFKGIAESKDPTQYGWLYLQ
ncbi:MAG TPA: sugar-binding protein [Armatimonadota bacterium]|nr:sugar-binding protein [Armatimonadota bacterium]